MYMMYPPSSPLSLFRNHATWRMRRSCPLLLHCCLIRPLWEDIISERIQKQESSLKTARLKKPVRVCVYLYDKEREWGWDGCFQLTNRKQAGSESEPITTAERAGFHGDDAGMMLVPIDCWRGSAVGCGTGTHMSGDTQTHTHTPQTLPETDSVANDVRRRAGRIRRDIDITGNYIMLSTPDRHAASLHQCVYTQIDLLHNIPDKTLLNEHDRQRCVCVSNKGSLLDPDPLSEILPNPRHRPVN